jgi:hypothetical protein
LRFWKLPVNTEGAAEIRSVLKIEVKFAKVLCRFSH